MTRVLYFPHEEVPKEVIASKIVQLPRIFIIQYDFIFYSFQVPTAFSKNLKSLKRVKEPCLGMAVSSVWKRLT